MKRGKFIASIEARVGSTRLPGKVLKKILGKPMLELMIERVKRAHLVEEIIVVTSNNAKDNLVENLASRLRVKCFRGSEDDVLDRVLKAAEKYHAKHIVELWGDCPLIDPLLIDACIRYYLKNNFDLIATSGSNIGKGNFPLGMSLLIFSTRVLKEISLITNDPIDRENVSNYIYEHPERYKIGLFPCSKNYKRPELRLVVDEKSDFELIKKVFENLYIKKKYFSFDDVIKFLDAYPVLKNINKNVEQKKLR